MNSAQLDRTGQVRLCWTEGGLNRADSIFPSIGFPITGCRVEGVPTSVWLRSLAGLPVVRMFAAVWLPLKGLHVVGSSVVLWFPLAGLPAIGSYVVVWLSLAGLPVIGFSVAVWLSLTGLPVVGFSAAIWLSLAGRPVVGFSVGGFSIIGFCWYRVFCHRKFALLHRCRHDQHLRKVSLHTDRMCRRSGPVRITSE